MFSINTYSSAAVALPKIHIIHVHVEDKATLRL